MKKVCNCSYGDTIIAGRRGDRKIILVECKCGIWTYELVKFEPHKTAKK